MLVFGINKTVKNNEKIMKKTQKTCDY